MSLQIVKLLDPIQMTISGTFTPKGAYNAATDYAVGDQVDYNGSSYIMYADAAAGTVPTNTSYWGLVASKGDTGGTGTLADLGGQPLDATLTSLSAYNTNGILTQTAADTFTGRTITGTANQITVTNGDGVSGNPTLALPNAITLPGTLTITGHTSPQADSTYTLGTSSLYWKETYTDKIFLNSTATLDGSTAGVMNVNANIDMNWHELYGAWNISAYNTITAGGGVEVTDATKGVILKSPDGTRYKLTIANGGTVTVSAA